MLGESNLDDLLKAVQDIDLNDKDLLIGANEIELDLPKRKSLF